MHGEHVPDNVFFQFSALGAFFVAFWAFLATRASLRKYGKINSVFAGDVGHLDVCTSS